MANKINFITGETYTLAELFSGERRIIVPDLQRDYCWGDESNIKSSGEKGELVSDFIKNLKDQYYDYKEKGDKSSLNLGLFYGYEIPADHIQLCDGQQRLTTLYLLLGMINKRTSKIRNNLISDYEFKHGTKEPYLSYSIRESSLYFLHDLVSKFFIDNSDNVESIHSPECEWYYDDYNYDPSIQSMLNALSKIEKIIQHDSDNELSEFGDWLLNKVTFLYFDMENRKNGEETFVVINTTGESLSMSQNLKPLVISANKSSPDVSVRWEEIETWFWKKRSGENDTADAGFDEFLRWVLMIEKVNDPVPVEQETVSTKKLIQLILNGKNCDFQYDSISFEKIYRYWQALEWINKEQYKFVDDYLSPALNYYVSNRKAIGQNDCFVLLPVLKFVFNNYDNISDENTKRNVFRVYKFFSNIIKIKNVGKAINTLVGDAICLVDKIKDEDIVSLADLDVYQLGLSEQILTKEEMLKLRILKNSNNRVKFEEEFWDAQEHNIWFGEILPMIDWSTIDGIFNFNAFQIYNKKFKEVFSGDCGNSIDCLRRALLSEKLNNFPLSRGANLSLCWEWEDWQELINANKEWFKNFFDSFNLGKSTERIQEIINNCSDQNMWFKLVNNPEYINYCDQKNIRKDGDNLLLIKRHKATTYETIENFFKELSETVNNFV